MRYSGIQATNSIFCLQQFRFIKQCLLPQFSEVYRQSWFLFYLLGAAGYPSVCHWCIWIFIYEYTTAERTVLKEHIKISKIPLRFSSGILDSFCVHLNPAYKLSVLFFLSFFHPAQANITSSNNFSIVLITFGFLQH